MKPTMLVQEGDSVKRGQALFSDKKNEGVIYTSPSAGTVASINRGAKRVLLSVVIDVAGSAAVDFGAVGVDGVSLLDGAAIKEKLIASGLWTALRTRPFSKVPQQDSQPHSIFITALDTNPLAADAAIIVAEYATEFAVGLDALAKLTQGTVFVCQEAGKFLPAGTDPKLSIEEFSGIHPAGLPGTHIHFLDPVSPTKTVWFINYQDVIAVGHLFIGGELDSTRVVAIGGPGAANPRLVRTVIGANLEELTAGELNDGEQRVISGSVFSGRSMEHPTGFLGRYHLQISILPEDRTRRLLGYLTPGVDRHSVFPIYLSKWLRRKELRFSNRYPNSKVRNVTSVRLASSDQSLIS